MRSLNTEQRLKEAKKRFMADFFFRLSHVRRFFFEIFIINIIIIIILFVQVSAVPCAIAFKLFDVVPFDFLYLNNKCLSKFIVRLFALRSLANVVTHWSGWEM